jgi:hypothetical protein
VRARVAAAIAAKTEAPGVSARYNKEEAILRRQRSARLKEARAAEAVVGTGCECGSSRGGTSRMLEDLITSTTGLCGDEAR